MLAVSPPTCPFYSTAFSFECLPALSKFKRIPANFSCRFSKNSLETDATLNFDSFTKYSGYLFERGASEAESLEAYDYPKITAIYRQKPFLVLRRLFQIGTTFGRWFGVRYLDLLMERSDQMFMIRAAELRMILVELGPAFVKIAQAVSSRPDVIPPAYLEELSVLQDRIAPFSTEIAFVTIEQELGLPIDMLFSEISPEPIAAASLGQVYQAKLLPSGQLVAVKVQRPGVQAAISLDIFILRFLAGFLRRAAKLNTDLQAVVDEWASSLFRWMNFGIDDLELQNLAIRILSQTCSSSGCERNWSVFERIHTKRRNRLEHKRLNDLVYTHYNLHSKERQASRKSLADPISLENIDLTDEWVVEAEVEDAPLLDVGEVEDWMDVADAILDEGEGADVAGYFLNPRFHYQEGFEFSDNIRSGVTKVIERLAPNVTFAIEATREEMDYRAEARNGMKFRELYGRLQDVFIPEMYLEYTSRRVLVMEWIEGQKLSEVKDLYLVEVGVNCSLTQLLDYGYYHADPHPGNLMRTLDGKLAYLDFGMMGEFRQELRDGLIEACLHLVNRDFDTLAKDFVTLGLIPPTAQKDEVAKALTDVFQNAVNKGVRNLSFGDLSGNLGRTMYKFRFQLPSYFYLVIRSLAVLEGIAISFNPDYKVLSSSYPWIAKKVLTDSSPQLRSTLQALLYKEGVFRIDRLESLLTESRRSRLEKPSLKVEEKEENDSRVVIKEILSFTLTEKGAFVREILLEEFAKGIDALGLATLDSLTSRLPLIVPFSSVMADEDITNLKTLHRLLLLLSGFQKNQDSNAMESKNNRLDKNSKAYLEEASLVLYQLTSVEEILPVLSVVPELPPESQQQLVRLPADLISRLVSRTVARTIRRAFI